MRAAYSAGVAARLPHFHPTQQARRGAAVTLPARSPPRIRIERIWPQTRRRPLSRQAPARRARRRVGDARARRARGARRRACATGRPERGAGARRRSPRSRRIPIAGTARSPPTRLGRWQFGVVAWVDRMASWRHELERKVAAGQSDLASELSEGAALLGVAALTVEEGLAAAAGDRSERGRERRRARAHGRRRARDVRLLVRAVPALVGRLRGRREGAARARRARLRRALPAARAPDRADASQGPQQRAQGAPLRSRQPVGDRQRGRRAHRPASRPRQRGGLREHDRARRRARHRDRARLRDPVLARPSLAAGAPRLVPPPARRHAQVRREPAQALPGHLQRQLRHRGLARAVGGAARRRRALGRARRHGLPRRQPAHQADPVLGVADRRRAGASTRRRSSWPRRSRGRR